MSPSAILESSERVLTGNKLAVTRDGVNGSSKVCRWPRRANVLSNPSIIAEEESLPLIKAAYDAGINFFDTADIYSNGVSEVITGKAIKKFDLPRNEIVVATKLFGTVARNWEKASSGIGGVSVQG